uniref:Uncharacterized protein n=1 Tax=Anguilla anguilla TaxID=7936 RepID=A0A0E9S9W3_ANGAN
MLYSRSINLFFLFFVLNKLFPAAASMPSGYLKPPLW